jgi:hypothetical protein
VEVLPWERVLWTGRPLLLPREAYALTDFRLVVVRDVPVAEIALQDVGDVEHTSTHLERMTGRSTVTIHPRAGRSLPIVFRHIRQGAQLAAIIELLAGDPQAPVDATAVHAALAWNPGSSHGGWAEGLAGLGVLGVALVAVTVGLGPTSARIVYGPGDAIYPDGRKRDRAEIVQFMESAVMPWARAVLGPLKGGADRVTCATCHGQAPEARGWSMPAVAALPEPHVAFLGWELYNNSMDAQIRNAIYGYVAESDNQARAAYMRKVVMPGMAALLGRPAYDFTRSYDYNRTRLAFGCYHCHTVK